MTTTVNRPTRGQRSPLAPHGTSARATGRPMQGIRGCTCQPCRDAKNRAWNIRRLQAAAGHPVRINTEPVAQHIRDLLAAGMSWPHLTEAAACSTSTIHRVLAGQELIRRATAERILAVQPAPDPRTYTGTVGARRRIQALLAIGHTVRGISADSKVDDSVVREILNGHKPRAQRETVDRISRTYDRLATRANTYSRPHAVSTSIRRAARNSWPDPLWWEDMGHIDDPDFDPTTAEKKLTRNELAALRRTEVEHLASYGYDTEAIAQRLDMHVKSVRSILAELRTGQRRDRSKAAA